MFCSKCGSEIQDGARFCPKCGNSTIADNAGSANKPPKSTDKMVLLIGGVVAVVILSIVFTIILFKGAGGSKKIVGVWAYDASDSENNGTFKIHSGIPIKDQCYINFMSDGSIVYGNTETVNGSLDKWSIVDKQLKWQRPLGSANFYDYELSGNRLVLHNDDNVAVFRKFKSVDEAVVFFEGK